MRPPGRRRRDEELDEEIEGHLRMAVRERVERGEAPEQAEAAARREFGNVTLVKEVTREMWGWAWFRQFVQDMRYGLRTMRRSPGFAAVAVIAIALGIGANTAIFSVVNSVLLRPLPYGDADRLVVMWEDNRKADHSHNAVNPANFLDWQSRAKSFEATAAFYDTQFTLTGAGDPVSVPAQLCTTNLFGVLGSSPLLGRTFTDEDLRTGRLDVIVLSYGLWQRQFGGAADVIGKTVALENTNVTVIGVMPADFKWFVKENSRSGNPAELWAPFVLRPRQGRFLTAVGRLKDGVSFDAAQAEMNTIAARLAEEHPDRNANMGATLVPLRRQLAGEIRTPLLVLLGAVALVLLIACANVANLTLARAAARSKEIAIRAALGAGGIRIVRQLLTESLLLSLAGGLLGVGLAMWGVEALVSLAPPNLIGSGQVGVNLPVLAFTLGVSVLTGVIFGLLPALEASRTDANEALKESGRGNSGSARSRRARSAFVVAQVALALMLLVGAGLLVRSFERLVAVDPGFDPSNLLTARVQLPARKYKEDRQIANFFRQATQQIAALPGVRSVSVGNYLPFYTGLGARTSFSIEGRPDPPPGQEPSTDVRVVDESYFSTLGIPVLRGRPFNPQEGVEDRQTIIISEALARKYFPGENPVGKRISVLMKDNPPMNEIVGVVGDVHYNKLSEESYPTVYWTEPQLTQSEMTFVVRTDGDPTSLGGSLRRAVQSVDPQQPVSDVRTMESWIGESVSRARFGTTLLTVFACLALLLAGVGIYGVMAYTVTQRQHEIGIRMALGARAGDVLGMIVRQGMTLALAGVGVGLFGGLALTRVISSLLFGVSATDPLTFAGVSLLLVAIALAACFVPARRATKVDPLTALRTE